MLRFVYFNLIFDEIGNRTIQLNDKITKKYFVPTFPSRQNPPLLIFRPVNLVAIAATKSTLF